MINVNDVSRISSILSESFFFGFSNGYSEECIEEKVINSQFVNELENGESTLINKLNFKEIVESIYSLNINEELIKINTLSLWLGEVYTKLFFTFNKSLAFIFLYLPLKEGIRLFHLYHETDFSHAIEYFKKEVSKNTVLTLLLNKNNMSAKELSVLTNISFNTIVNLTRNNDAIYNAKYDSLYKISQIFHVKSNIFVRNVNNYTESGMYDFDKTNRTYRLYLGYLYALYFDKEIGNTAYKFEKETISNRNEKFVVLSKTNHANKSIKQILSDYAKEHDDISNTILTIFSFEDKQYNKEDLIKLDFKKILIIDSSYFIRVYNKKVTYKKIKNVVKDSLNRIAKMKTSDDYEL